jgi:hypothetical protein
MASEDVPDGIHLQAETINIGLHTGYYSVDVDFTFQNSGPKRILSVGFPLFSKADSSNTALKTFENFHTYVDGVETPFALREVPNYKDDGLDLFYVRQVQFRGNGITHTRVTYRSHYSKIGFGEVVPYLFGTGKTWGARAWDLHMNISNDSDEWIYDLQIGYVSLLGQETAKVNNFNDMIELGMKEILPTKLNDMIEIVSLTWMLEAPEEMDRWYPKGISDTQLKLLTKSQLRLMRNYFYALHGYEFSSPDLRSYFGKMSWYKPNSEFTEDQLGWVEMETVARISAEESRR